MSPKGFILGLSLAGTVAALSCWMFKGQEEVGQQPVAKAQIKAARSRQVSPPVLPDTKAQPRGARSVAAKTSLAAASQAAAGLTLSTEELTARAARVEQEANHDLRRLVQLLDLDEVQQDRVFQTLAQHSPSWTPSLQFAPATGTATAAGKRGDSIAAAPAFSAAPVTEPNTAKSPAAADTPSLAATPVSGETAAGKDSTDEIMALLDGDQQDTLLEAELDRAAWWAEILEQITPPDEVPALTPGTPASGAEEKAYEGSDVLE